MTLEITGISAGYDGTRIIRDIDCHAEPGEVVGVVGKNGVGKTTLLKAVMGVLPAQDGSIQLHGEDLVDEPAHVRARRGIGYVPQGRDIFPGLTVKENLLVGENVGEDDRTRYEEVYEYFPILEERADQDAGTMSGGQQQMLAIARALVGDPQLLLVDEPSEGVQPSIVQSITEDLARISDESNTTILFVEQNMHVVRSLADRCYAMDKGEIVDELDRAAIQDQEKLESYLVI